MSNFESFSFYNNQPFNSYNKYSCSNDGYVSNYKITQMIRQYSSSHKSPVKSSNEMNIENTYFNLSRLNKLKNINYAQSRKEVSNVYVSNDNGKLSASMI